MADAAATAVGRVLGLWRYPVKSMAAEPLDDAEVSWFGVAGDRRWAFVRPGLSGSGFPWLTLREQPALRRHRPRLAEPGRPDRSATLVDTPDGASFEITDPALAARLGDGVRVMRQDRGIFDTFPLSLISAQAIAGLQALAGRPLDAARFRPNLLLDVPGEEPFPEDAWLGAVLRIGTLRLRIDQRDGRCAVITLDPATDEREPALLRTLTAQRQGCLGVYGSTVQPGRVAVGDTVWLER